MLNQAGIIHSKRALYLQMQQLLENSLQALQNLYHKLAWRTNDPVAIAHVMSTHLQLNLRLSNVLLAAIATSNLVRLGDLVPHVLGAEILKCVALDGVDTELGAGLDSGEAAGHCTCDLLARSFQHLPLTHLQFTVIGVTYGRTACCHRPPQ